LQKILNKCCSFKRTIHQRIQKKGITVSTKILSSTMFRFRW